MVEAVELLRPRLPSLSAASWSRRPASISSCGTAGCLHRSTVHRPSSCWSSARAATTCSVSSPTRSARAARSFTRPRSRVTKPASGRLWRLPRGGRAGDQRRRRAAQARRRRAAARDPALSSTPSRPRRGSRAPRGLAIFGHVGDGNLHVNLLGLQADGETVDEAVLPPCAAAEGGSIAAEHGVKPLRKRRWLETFVRSEAELHGACTPNQARARSHPRSLSSRA